MIFYGASANAGDLGLESIQSNIIILSVSGMISSFICMVYAPRWKRRLVIMICLTVVVLMSALILVIRLLL